MTHCKLTLNFDDMVRSGETLEKDTMGCFYDVLVNNKNAAKLLRMKRCNKFPEKRRLVAEKSLQPSQGDSKNTMRRCSYSYDLTQYFVRSSD